LLPRLIQKIGRPIVHYMGYFPIHALYISHRTHVQGLEHLSVCLEHQKKALSEVRTTYSTTLCTFVRFAASPTTENHINCNISFMQLPSTSSRPTTGSHISCLTHPASRTTHFVIECETMSCTMLSDRSG
jgi:hypothetical protein